MLGPGGRTSLWDADVLTGRACPAHLPFPDTLPHLQLKGSPWEADSASYWLPPSPTDCECGGRETGPRPPAVSGGAIPPGVCGAGEEACEYQWGQLHSILRCRQLFLTIKIYPPDLSTKPPERHSLRWNLTISLERWDLVTWGFSLTPLWDVGDWRCGLRKASCRVHQWSGAWTGVWDEPKVPAELKDSPDDEFLAVTEVEGRGMSQIQALLNNHQTHF